MQTVLSATHGSWTQVKQLNQPNNTNTLDTLQTLSYTHEEETQYSVRLITRKLMTAKQSVSI